MPFKTNRLPEPAITLAGFSLLGFTGPNAADFLQAQTMNDVAALAPGHWQWNGWLTPKGRVIALFALARLQADAFVAVLPDFPASELQPMLQRFVFRSKLRIHVMTELVVAGSFDAIARYAAGGRNQAEGNAETGYAMDFGGDSMARTLHLLPAADPSLAPPGADFDARWRAADLAHGLPRLEPVQREAWTPQMLSLERLQAYSLKKGCYPGQEIVARTHYLGHARRGLARVAGSGLEQGMVLADQQGTNVGSLVSVTPDGAAGLAVIQVDRRAEPVFVDGRAVTLPAFEQGLGRPA